MSKLKKYILLSLYLLMASLNFNLILKPLELVTGGTQGLSIIINNLLSIKPSLFILIFNIITITTSYLFLKKESTYSALASTFIYPFFIKLTNFLPSLNIKNFLIASIIAGITSGITSGFIYRLGFSSGGTTILNLLLSKYFHLKISLSNFIINSIIILIGLFLFGIKKTIYSLLVITIGSLIIHFILKKNY